MTSSRVVEKGWLLAHHNSWSPKKKSQKLSSRHPHSWKHASSSPISVEGDTAHAVLIKRHPAAYQLWKPRSLPRKENETLLKPENVHQPIAVCLLSLWFLHTKWARSAGGEKTFDGALMAARTELICSVYQPGGKTRTRTWQVVIKVRKLPADTQHIKCCIDMLKSASQVHPLKKPDSREDMTERQRHFGGRCEVVVGQLSVI